MSMLEAKKRNSGLILIGLLVLFFYTPQIVYGQGNDYTIHLGKDFGYAWGSDIQGKFTISLVGDEELVEKVYFLFDGELISIIQEPPFEYQFNTVEFIPGNHSLSAEVWLKNGNLENTPILEYHFVPPDYAKQELTEILLWIGGTLLGVMTIAVIVQIFAFKGRKKVSHQTGKRRDYGVLGGAVCPKCGYPFPQHIWGINLLVGKLDRCEHCGKWVMVRRATPEELQEAEEIESSRDIPEQGAGVIQKDENSLLDETKYIDDI